MRRGDDLWAVYFITNWEEIVWMLLKMLARMEFVSYCSGQVNWDAPRLLTQKNMYRTEYSSTQNIFQPPLAKVSIYRVVTVPQHFVFLFFV